MSPAMKQIAVAYLAVVLALSLVAFVFYGFDNNAPVGATPICT